MKRIIVNGIKHRISGREVDYRTIVSLAYGAEAADAARTYTVVFFHGPPANLEGSLTRGRQPVRLSEGMAFSVTVTGHA